MKVAGVEDQRHHSVRDRRPAETEQDDVVIAGDGGGPDTFRGIVDIVEYLGREDEAIVRLPSGGQLWVRTNARVAPGDNVYVTLPPARVIFLPAEGAGGAA